MSSTSLASPPALRPSTAARLFGRTPLHMAALAAAATFVIAAAGLIALLESCCEFCGVAVAATGGMGEAC